MKGRFGSKLAPPEELTIGKNGILTDLPMHRVDVFRMVRRRAPYTIHSERTAGIGITNEIYIGRSSAAKGSFQDDCISCSG